MSYHGGLRFGLLGDYDAMRDIDVVGDALEDAFDDLRAAARVPSQRAGRFTPAGDRARHAV